MEDYIEIVALLTARRTTGDSCDNYWGFLRELLEITNAHSHQKIQAIPIKISKQFPSKNPSNSTKFPSNSHTNFQAIPQKIQAIPHKFHTNFQANSTQIPTQISKKFPQKIHKKFPSKKTRKKHEKSTKNGFPSEGFSAVKSPGSIFPVMFFQ